MSAATLSSRGALLQHQRVSAWFSRGDRHSAQSRSRVAAATLGATPLVNCSAPVRAISVRLFARENGLSRKFGLACRVML